MALLSHLLEGLAVFRIGDYCHRLIIIYIPSGKLKEFVIVWDVDLRLFEFRQALPY